MKEKTCGFTGHRHLDEGQAPFATLKIMEEVLDASIDGYTRFITGLAEGADMIFAKTVVLLKKYKPEMNIELVAAISHRGRLETKDESFQWLLSRCDRVVVLSEYYHPGVYARRNKWMLERSSRLIAAYDGRKTGGTAQTVAEAEKMGLEIRTLNLNSTKPEPHHRIS